MRSVTGRPGMRQTRVDGHVPRGSRGVTPPDREICLRVYPCTSTCLALEDAGCASTSTAHPVLRTTIVEVAC
jgi:hypothetical protein